MSHRCPDRIQPSTFRDLWTLMLDLIVCGKAEPGAKYGGARPEPVQLITNWTTWSYIFFHHRYTLDTPLTRVTLQIDKGRKLN